MVPKKNSVIPEALRSNALSSGTHMCMRSMLTIEPKNINWVPAFAGMTREVG